MRDFSTCLGQRRKKGKCDIIEQTYCVERSNYDLTVSDKLIFIKEKSYHLIISEDTYNQKLILATH